jgi:FkbM family methyltransferase
MQEIATRYGTLKTHDDDDLISRCLAIHGEWAQHESQFVADNLPAESRIADIGAFLGTFGLGLSQLTKVQSLCFVEANAVTAGLLRENVERNASVESRVIESVVGPFDGTRAGTYAAGNLGSFSVVKTEAADGKIASPSASSSISLKALTEQQGPFDLYKLDVEGAEKAIFTSELDFIQRCESTFWVECNETTASLDVADLLIKCGFSVF